MPISNAATHTFRSSRIPPRAHRGVGDIYRSSFSERERDDRYVNGNFFDRPYRTGHHLPNDPGVVSDYPERPYAGSHPDDTNGRGAHSDYYPGASRQRLSESDRANTTRIANEKARSEQPR